ncbi:MAG: CHAT domain-containing protein [Betaproteobacteria bacterium]|nr:CHAT domain-containing protein [Betaproteobacteria bacterium]
MPARVAFFAQRLYAALVVAAWGFLIAPAASAGTVGYQIAAHSAGQDPGCAPALGSAFGVALVLPDGGTSTSTGELGWLRWSDRLTFALQAQGRGDYRLLAPDVEGELEVGRVQQAGPELFLTLRVGIGPCRPGQYAFDLPPVLSAQSTQALRDQLATLFALERGLEQSGNAAPRDHPNLPETIARIESMLSDLLGPRHPQTLLARAHRAHGLVLAAQPVGALALLDSLAEEHARIVPARDHDLLRVRHIQLLALEEINRSAEVIDLGEALLKQTTDSLGESHPLRWRIMATMAQRHVQLRNYQRAKDLAERAHRGLVELLGESHTESLRVKISLATVLYVQFRGDEALRMLEPMLQVARSRFGEADRLSLRIADLMARAYYQTGRWREGLPVAETVHAMSVREFPPSESLRRYATELLAWWYRELGRYAEAEMLLREALASGVKHLGEGHSVVSETRTQLALLLLAMNRPAAAFAQSDLAYRQARQEAGEANHRTLWIRGIRAQALDRLRKREEALAEAQAVVAGFRQLYGAVALDATEAMIVAGRSESYLGRHDQAIATLRAAALEQQTARPYDHPDRIQVLAELGLALRRGGRLGEAIQTWEQFVEEAERLREGVGPIEEYRQGFLQHWSPTYRRLVDTQLRVGRIDRAFALSEMIKGRTLLEMLSARLADGAGLISPSETERLRVLRDNLAQRDQALGSLAAQGPERAAALHGKADAARLLRDFRAQLAVRYPKYAQLSRIQLRGTTDAAMLVPEDTAFVSFLSIEKGILAFAYTREQGLVWRRISVPGGIGDLVRAYRSLLAPAPDGVPEVVWRLRDGSYRLAYVRPEVGARRVSSVRPVARELRRLLLDPLGEILAGKERWIISPDDSLALLPFEALPWRGGIVVERHELSYIQSLSVLGQLRERPETASVADSILAMGDPDYRREPAANKRQGPGQTAVLSASALRQEEQLRDRRWTSLPGSAEEVRRAVASFPEDSRAVFLAAEASEPKLLALNRSRELARHRYLLFSTHALLNTEAPQISSVVLAQHRPTAEADGYVTAAEWVEYNLDSELIVLSGCETALGPNIRGEGVTGLPYALLVAGNRNALLSLWKIDDAAAASLVPQVFAQLRAGRSPAPALTLAKRAMLRDRKYAFPGFWAAFVLYGG